MPDESSSGALRPASPFWNLPMGVPLRDNASHLYDDAHGGTAKQEFGGGKRSAPFDSTDINLQPQLLKTAHFRPRWARREPERECQAGDSTRSIALGDELCG